MNSTPKATVRYVRIAERDHGKRIDNVLRRWFSRVPRSRIYSMIRSGEMRLNKRRCQASTRVHEGDMVRIPPLAVRCPNQQLAPTGVVRSLMQNVLYEDECIVVINKPGGLAVHGGSTTPCGLVEILKQQGRWNFIELVHRIDRDTSGCLLLARKISALKLLHRQLWAGQVEKSYLALVDGLWSRKKTKIDLPLKRTIASGGERFVRVDATGKPSTTLFCRLCAKRSASLLHVLPRSGRTHQIRVHCQHAGHPVLGDPRYGLRESNKEWQQKGLNRLFLHAYRLRFAHPESGNATDIKAPLPAELTKILKQEQLCQGAERFLDQPC